MHKPRVVITGLGVIAPNAIGINDFTNALRNGISGIKSVPLMKEKGFRCTVGGTVSIPSDYLDQYISPSNKVRMSPAMIYALLAAIECYRDAGHTFDPLLPVPDNAEPDWNTGCIIGSTNNGIDYLYDHLSDCWKTNNIKRMGIAAVERTMTSGLSAKIAGSLGLGNKVSTNSSACCTGTEAIIDAYNHIVSGRAHAMICGAGEGGAPHQWSGFDAMRLINSKFNDTPEKASRPFSESSNTFIPGEGAGMLFMETLEHAQNRGARIYAEILSGTCNCGAQRQGGSMTAPNSKAVQRCIRDALEMANIKAQDIDYINGHLTGTMGDTIELMNWSKALDLDAQSFPYINGTKALIGHCLSAAGAIEVVATLLQMHHQFIHPAINSEDLYPELADFRDKIPLTMIQKKIHIAAKASLGFGDVNSVLILKNGLD